MTKASEIKLKTKQIGQTTQGDKSELIAVCRIFREH